MEHIRRSMLFIPGGNEKLLDKGLGLEVDALILDLEDAVAVSKKEEARKAVTSALQTRDFGRKEKVVRVNALSTEWGRTDIEEVIQGKPDLFLFPKVEKVDDILSYDQVVSEVEGKTGLPLGKIGFLALIESPLGIINIDLIARSSPRLKGFLFGAADFTRETHGAITADRSELYYPLMRILLAARAFGLDAIDSPFFDIKDLTGLERHTRQAKDLGYDGKALIHPSQVEVINRIFTPTEEELTQARRVIEAFQSAQREGRGASQLDGKLIENVHVAMAERILKISELTRKNRNYVK
jgi:citrate lyase subunit beta / citryl-CoA lyase